ncbi:MAG TPA: hypothetical protein VFQ24_00465 [Terriglobia bacterium]|nr:hypothetical protein [Terriglobia bacterium]
MRIAVVDSTPLIHLVHLGLCGEISLFFDVVYVPMAVQREVNRKSRFRYRLKKLYETGYFLRCTTANAENVKLLRPDVDEGEAEALIQAQERTATHFIGDDRRAREIGSNMGFRCVGTVRILARLFLEGRASETRSLVRKLQRDLRFRVSEQVIQQAIAMAEEPI